MRVLFAIVLLTCTAFAEPATEDCDDLYLGLDHPPDETKALACYTKATQNPNDDNARLMLALMHLNGEGTKKDVAKAAKVLGEKSEENPILTRLQAEIAKQQQTPSAMRVDYCNDLAQSQLDLNQCAFMKNRRAKRLRSEAMAKVAEMASPAAKEALHKVSIAFDVFADKEGVFAMSPYEGGSIAPMIGAGAVASWEDNFRKLLSEKIGASPSDDFRAEDKKLNAKYKALQKRTEGNLKKAMREAQRSWVGFRDAWASFAAVVDPAAKDTALAKVTRLRVRDFEQWIEELRHR